MAPRLRSEKRCYIKTCQATRLAGKRTCPLHYRPRNAKKGGLDTRTLLVARNEDLERTVQNLRRRLLKYEEVFQQFQTVRNLVLGLSERTDALCSEAQIRDEVAANVQGQTEVVLPSGDRIDVLTEDTIYEVKRPSLYKAGIGQLTVYRQFYPTHKLVLYLTRQVAPVKMNTILADCRRADIFCMFR